MIALGFDVGATSLRGGLVDGERIVRREKRAVPRTPEALTTAVDDIARAIDPEGRAPIGIGIAAMIPTPRTHLERAPNFDWDDVPLKVLVEEKTGRPVTLLNDLEAILLGEAHAGAAKGRQNVLCVFFGTGLGAAALVNGELLLGARGVALELGHVKVTDGERLCGCGKRGCIETLVGGRYLLERARQMDSQSSDLSPLRDTAIIDELAEGGARAVVSALTTLNPERLVLGGGVFTGLPDLYGALCERILDMLTPPARVGFDITRASLGDDAGIVGAARAAMSQ